MTAALKSADAVRLSALRMLLSAIGNAVIAKYGAGGSEKLTDADIVDVIKKQAKAHRESIEAYQKAGRLELAAKEKAELDILAAYLPEEISDDELNALLAPVVLSGKDNFGLLMKQAMEVAKGKADGGRVAAVLKQMLAQ